MGRKGRRVGQKSKHPGKVGRRNDRREAGGGHYPQLKRICFVEARAAPVNHALPARDDTDGRFSKVGGDESGSGFRGAWTTPGNELTSTSWPFVHGEGPGMHNFGNTCYLNSSLQCLLYCPPLANLLLSRRHSLSRTSVEKHNEFCVYCAMERLAGQVHGSSNAKAAIAPKEFVANIRGVCRTFRSMRQEDAHEFVHHILEKMTSVAARGQCGSGLAKGRTSKRTRAPDEMNTIIHRIFGGCLQSTVTCTSCHFVSLKLDPSLDLSLEISRSDSVEKSLRSFTAPERLEGTNKYHCSKCNKLVPAVKQMSIRRSPVCLTVQLKRFDGLRKNNRPVTYPEILDLRPFMINPPDNTTALYKLCGVLVHVGASSQSGHYFSFVRGSNGTWIRKDDSRSQTVGLSVVLNQKAYLLFYTRVNDEKETSTAKPTNNVAESEWEDRQSRSDSCDDSILWHSSNSSSSASSDIQSEVDLDELADLLGDATDDLPMRTGLSRKTTVSVKHTPGGILSKAVLSANQKSIAMYSQSYRRWRLAMRQLKSHKSVRAIAAAHNEIVRMRELRLVGPTRTRTNVRRTEDPAQNEVGEIFNAAGKWENFTRPQSTGDERPEYSRGFPSRKRLWDAWDAAYDQGRIRKVRASEKSPPSNENPFQKRQSQAIKR